MSYKKDNILTVLKDLDILEYQKNIIEKRYGSEINSLYKKSTKATCIYKWSTIIVTTLSILLPGLLSIQKSNESLEIPIYWISWSISFILTLLQGYTKLFKVDRNYYFYNFNYERFISEGWSYIHLGGRYNTKDTHKQAYKRFMRNIERMKLENVNLEFTDVKDSDEVTKKKKKKEGETDLLNQSGTVRRESLRTSEQNNQYDSIDNNILQENNELNNVI